MLVVLLPMRAASLSFNNITYTVEQMGQPPADSWEFATSTVTGIGFIAAFYVTFRKGRHTGAMLNPSSTLAGFVPDVCAVNWRVGMHFVVVSSYPIS